MRREEVAGEEEEEEEEDELLMAYSSLRAVLAGATADMASETSVEQRVRAEGMFDE